MQPFHPFFPLAESIAKAFYWFFIWNFKRKASTISMIQPKRIALAQHLIDTVSYQLISLSGVFRDEKRFPLHSLELQKQNINLCYKQTQRILHYTV